MAVSVRIHSLKNQAVIADKCHVAKSFRDRFAGLMGRSGLGHGEGMLFPKCNSIHMWFMRFPIDVIFLRGGKVISVHRGVRPWKVLPLNEWKAQDTVELPVGTVDRCGIEPGDELCIS